VPRPQTRRQEIAALLVAALPVPAQVIDAAAGWPSIVRVDLGTGSLKLRIYCGVIHDPGRGSTEARPADERRMQNPGSNTPIGLEPGAVTLVMGWWDEGASPVVVMFDAKRREGRVSRQSIQVKPWTLEAAEASGWAVQYKGNGEVAIAMRPNMVPFYLQDVHLLAHSGDPLSMEDVESLEAAGSLEAAIEEQPVLERPEAAEAVERVRAQVERFLRSPRFRRQVVAAYGGRCAACGMQLEMVEAAHLWPAANPGSPDTLDNGICLCRNHHRAFDYGLIRIDPRTWRIEVDDRVRESLRARSLDDGLEEFEHGLRDTLLLPASPAERPDPLWLRRRYEEEW